MFVIRTLSLGEDYISPRDGRVNGGIVKFDPELGSRSTELTLPLFEDDIVEKTEYFRLTFAFEEDPNNPSPIVLSKCSPEEVLVAIQDNDGESDLVQHMNQGRVVCTSRCTSPIHTTVFIFYYC